MIAIGTSVEFYDPEYRMYRHGKIVDALTRDGKIYYHVENRDSRRFMLAHQFTEFIPKDNGRNHLVQEKNAHWQGANGQQFVIKDMETSHIINCMKVLERKMWAVISKGVPVDQKQIRSVTGGAVGELEKFKALEKELMKRLKAGSVTMGDWFLGSSHKKKGLKLK